MKDKNSTEDAMLRQKAEQELKTRHGSAQSPTVEADMLKLIHELEVHEIEFEMQKEELLIATEQAKNAEEKYIELYDFAPMGYMTLSKLGEITQINFAAANLLNKDRQHLMNHRFLLFVSNDTREMFSNFLKNVFTTHNKQSCEIIISIKEEPPLYIIAEGILSTNGDDCLITLVDISNRKESEVNLIKEKEKTERSELKFKGIFNRVADAIFSYDPDTFEIIEANAATSEMYGYDKDELIGMSCLKFSAEIEESIKNANKVEQQEESIVDLRRHKKKDGTLIFVQLQGHKIFVNNKPLIFAVSHDITAIKKFEVELIKAKEHAEESDRLKTAFLANMSHEIRTPMNGILGFTNLLQEMDLNSDEQQQYLRIIEKSGHRMLNTINEIIDIAKIESGQMEVNISSVNINEILGDCYSFFLPEAAEKNIQLWQSNFLQNEESFIFTDKVKLHGIFTNLIKNAIKYTRVGLVELGYVLNSSKTELQFFVKDTGIGIPTDRQAAIFERFIQADIQDTMALQGSGLGLTISRAYIEMLGGKIWVESKENNGSTFYFTLPFNNVVALEINKNTTVVEKQNQIKGLKILIVENDFFSTQLLTFILHHIAAEIITVNSGKDAVETCKNNPDIDLVLMDIQMPEMNGYEAVRQIRKFDKKMIIIAQTAFALINDREKSIRAGCNDYITKPIVKRELEFLIQKHF